MLQTHHAHDSLWVDLVGDIHDLFGLGGGLADPGFLHPTSPTDDSPEAISLELFYAMMAQWV